MLEHINPKNCNGQEHFLSDLSGMPNLWGIQPVARCAGVSNWCGV